MDLKEFDLNLLLVFDQLLKDRNLSRVAVNLGVTQPAVSRSLKRMRLLLGDELFCRTGRGMEPTAYALHLAEPIRHALESLQRAISEEYAFDPARSRRNFVLRLTEIGELFILPRLMRMLSVQAPYVMITVVRNSLDSLKFEMEDGQIDLAVGLIEHLETGFFSRQLLEQGYVCVFRSQHPLAGKKLSLEDFEAADHVVVDSSDTGHALIDEMIERQGIKRRVKLRVPDYGTLERLLQSTDLIATVPEALIHPDVAPLALAYSPHPLSLPRLPIRQLWHQRFHRDPGNRWLRELIAAHFTLLLRTSGE